MGVAREPYRRERPGARHATTEDRREDEDTVETRQRRAMIFGRVDEVDDAFVGTRFAFLLIPTECVYVARDPKKTKSEVHTGMRVLTDWRSVGLAYLRVWLPILAIALPLIQFFVGRVTIPVVLASIVMLALSIASHRLGRLPDAEKARLRVLGTIAGYRLDPTRLLPATRDIKRAALTDLMDKGGIPMTPADILSVIDDIPIPAMPLVYAYACYISDEPEWRECAAIVYARYEAGDM